MFTDLPPAIHGRGAADNPPNRFQPLARVPLPEVDPAEAPSPRTQFYHDASKSALTKNQSPDIPFEYGLNPYRGCEHGCVYCYARPTHEYLGFSAGLDFETRIMVKPDLPKLLRKDLTARSWRPQTVAVGTVTDPYQPIERELRLTRRCLEVFAAFRNPIGIVTKGALVARDADVLGEMAKAGTAEVYISITTLDPELARILEPRASTPQARLRAIRELRSAGVPVGVMTAPMIPGLNDHEAPAILQAAADAGAMSASYVVLRLPNGVKDQFADWLGRHFPERREKVLSRIRETRGGELNDSRFGWRMRGAGEWSEAFAQLYRVSRKKGRPGRRDAAAHGRALPPPGRPADAVLNGVARLYGRGVGE